MEVIEDLQICLPVKFHDFSISSLGVMIFLSKQLFPDEVWTELDLGVFGENIEALWDSRNYKRFVVLFISFLDW